MNTVAPGFVRSGITGAADFPDRFREDFAMTVPVRRIGEPEDIAAAVGYLASESAGFVTGQVRSPNGGYVI